MKHVRPFLSVLTLLALTGLSATTAAQVSGTVIDATTMAPIPGIRVGLQATTVRVRTDVNGMFSLPGATGTALVIVAAAEGYYNVSQTVDAPVVGVTLAIEAVPAHDNTMYDFLDPTQCGFCHSDQYAQWSTSPMALAGPNTWVYDIYNGTGHVPQGSGGFVYTEDSAFKDSNPNSECASCHQPEPWIKTPFSALEDINNLSVGAMHGISCEVCHKVAHIDEERLNFPGIYPAHNGNSAVVDFIRPNGFENQVQFGVLGDTDFTAGVMRPAYQSQMRAELCAACHQDKNDPDEDGDFEEANGVISEPTYFEWKNSPFGDPNSGHFADCVDCHMPAYGATRVAGGLGPERDPETIRSHAIVGTTPEFLENAVEMTATCDHDGDTLQVEVQIFNEHTGHHVPTGVTIRNMILLVEAWRESDGVPLAFTGMQTVHDLGGIGDPAQGYYAGLPGKLFAKVNHDVNMNGPTFFTDATGILFDNRIPGLETDVSQYTFNAPPGTGAVHVSARLIYRRAFRAFVDAKQWTEDGHGNPLEDIQAPHFGHLMESLEFISGPGPGCQPGLAVCFGVGCPCGNDDPTAGCANSTGSGALLGGTGSSSVVADDLVLTATNCPPNNSGLFFGGDTLFASPALVGDGLGCTGGLSHRFIPGTTSGAGVFTKSDAISSAPPGFIVPGVTRWFQAWTRDVTCGPPPNPCPTPCSSNNNLTNAYQVTFTP